MSRGKIFFSFFNIKNPSGQSTSRENNCNSLEEILESPIEKFISSQETMGDSSKFSMNQEIINELIKEAESKSGFLIMLPGPIRKFFQPKIEKLLENFNAREFEFPKNGTEMSEKLESVQEEVSCCLHILTNSLTALRNSSSSLNSPSMISNMEHRIPSFLVLKSELLTSQFYLNNLNKLVQNKSLMHGLFWIPQDQVECLEKSVEGFNNRRNSSILKISEEDPVKLSLVPPTSFYKSSFLNQFQEIVNTYGIPKYREINPAVFTAVTFPFLFGLMFGDIAHGSVLLGFALFLLLKSKSISISLNTSFLNIRSLAIILVFMGFFSVYVGSVYNDFLALPLTFFPSCYSISGDKYGIIFSLL
jgi:V-type H+-transporting ATPase subunit a